MAANDNIPADVRSQAIGAITAGGSSLGTLFGGGPRRRINLTQ
jgi:hypothetical protein